MLDGINDSDADARELVRLLAGIPAKINLIPFNPWPGTNYGCSPSSRIERFADIVNNEKLIFGRAAGVDAGHDVYCTEFGDNTFFVADQSFCGFIFVELFIGRVMNNLFDVSYAVLC